MFYFTKIQLKSFSSSHAFFFFSNENVKVHVKTRTDQTFHAWNTQQSGWTLKKKQSYWCIPLNILAFLFLEGLSFHYDPWEASFSKKKSAGGRRTLIFEHAVSPTASWSSRLQLRWWRSRWIKLKRLQPPKGWGGGLPLKKRFETSWFGHIFPRRMHR